MITRRSFLGGALGTGATAVLLGCGSDAKSSSPKSGSGSGGGRPSDEPVRLGLLSEQTGPLALYGTSMSRSVRLAVKELNDSGGILGRQVDIIEEDTQTDVSVAVDKARKLVHQDEVDLVVGPIGSDENDAAAKVVAEDSGKLYFFCEGYEGGKCDTFYFAFGTVPSQQTELFIPYLQEEYGPKVVLFGADFVWPRRTFDLAKETVASSGGEVVGELYLPIVTDDFTALVNEVRSARPDYIFALYPAVFGAALKALHDANLYGEVGVGNLFVGDPDLAGIGDLGEGMRSCLSFSKAIDTPEAQAFLDGFQSMHGASEVPGANESVTAYNAINMYKLAVEAAESTEAADVADALVGTSFHGPTGRVEMTSSHHVKQPVFAFHAEGGEYVFDRAFDPLDPDEPECS